MTLQQIEMGGLETPVAFGLAWTFRTAPIPPGEHPDDADAKNLVADGWSVAECYVAAVEPQPDYPLPAEAVELDKKDRP